MKRLGCLLSLLLLALAIVPAQAPAPRPGAPVRVAFTAVRNLDVDPRADYIGGLIQGLLLYDLSRTPELALVDRSSLDRVLEEQELRLSGLADDRESALKVGGLLGADFIVSAEYVALASEALVTIRVVDVATGRAGAFAERGGTENTVHRAAESLVEYLAGARPVFVGPSGERGIVSLRDEAPGSVALHSPIIRAEIFLDGEFAGYTTGKVDVPFMFEKLRPGAHTLRVHLGHGFGVVKLPEIAFRDWELAFELKPGERKVLRDQTRDFNSVLYDLQRLLDEGYYWGPETRKKTEQARALSFVDRKGERVELSLTLNPDDSSGVLSLAPELRVGGETSSWTVRAKPGEEVEFEETLGLARLSISIDMRYGRTYLDFDVERTDVWQGMYDE